MINYCTQCALGIDSEDIRRKSGMGEYVIGSHNQNGGPPRFSYPPGSHSAKGATVVTLLVALSLFTRHETRDRSVTQDMRNREVSNVFFFLKKLEKLTVSNLGVLMIATKTEAAGDSLDFFPCLLVVRAN